MSHDDSCQLEVRTVLRDMLSTSLARDGLGYKNQMMFTLPDCLRLKSEVSER